VSQFPPGFANGIGVRQARSPRLDLETPSPSATKHRLGWSVGSQGRWGGPTGFRNSVLARSIQIEGGWNKEEGGRSNDCLSALDVPSWAFCRFLPASPRALGVRSKNSCQNPLTSHPFPSPLFPGERGDGEGEGSRSRGAYIPTKSVGTYAPPVPKGSLQDKHRFNSAIPSAPIPQAPLPSCKDSDIMARHLATGAKVAAPKAGARATLPALKPRCHSERSEESRPGP
jgi:hypothetical protein